MGGKFKENGGFTYLGFYNLKIANLDPTGGKVRNFEFDADRPFSFSSLCTTHATSKPARHAPTVLIITFNRW